MKSNQRGFSKVLLVIVLILAAVGYFGWQKWQTANETKDWKTYRNEKYGFDVKYPPEWKILNEGETSYGNTLGFNVKFGISQVQVTAEIEIFEAKPDEPVAKAFQRITTIDPNALVKNNITVAGVHGEYYKNVPGNVPYDEAMLIYKTRFYGLIRHSAEDKIFTSFLPTFKFIQ